ncbi:MAG: iron-binding protein IscA [Nitrosomonas sp.]|jgi:iron-sulfur cluster assembly protein|nr:MAG: iron-binding protein IscA [Nitrosomonas sp.]
MAITLTENAAKQIQQQLLNRGKGIGLRVGIKKSGCSGFAYTFDYADEVGANEQLFKSLNTNVVIDIKNLPYLDGSQIDFVKEGLNSVFKFSNPNVDNTCGCGTSYSFKEA